MAAKLVAPKGGWLLARAAETLSSRSQGAPLAAEPAAKLAQWLDLLVAWNARVDLTAARSSDELVDLMVADALVLAARIPEGVRVIDVGTGAGAPGLALAILRPDLHVTLAEPLTKRAAFLRTVHGTLGLPHLTLDPRKGEEVAASHPGAWDVAIARATLAPAPWLELAQALVVETGSAWVFLAREPQPDAPGYTLAEEVAYRWPLTGADRRLVRYGRTVGGRAPG